MGGVRCEMKPQCRAFASSTAAQCRNRALPGADYCFRHLGKTPLLVSALLGALLSLGASELWRAFVPSAELQELRSLKLDMQPVLDLARERAPGASDREALQQLTDEVAKLRDQASRIRSLEIDVEVAIFGRWAGGTPPTSPGILRFGSSPDALLRIEGPDKKTQDVALFSTDLPSIKASGVDQSVVRYRASARSGSWPIGEPVSSLSALVGGQILLFGVGAEAMSDRKLGVRSMKLIVFANGQELVRLSPYGGDQMIEMPPGKYSSLPLKFTGRKPFHEPT